MTYNKFRESDPDLMYIYSFYLNKRLAMPFRRNIFLY
uniref:Uncharacterized protein n=1 Tax=Ciona intestinalis TaxID=7719 RepID=H2XRU6_CIOIN